MKKWLDVFPDAPSTSHGRGESYSNAIMAKCKRKPKSKKVKVKKVTLFH